MIPLPILLTTLLSLATMLLNVMSIIAAEEAPTQPPFFSSNENITFLTRLTPPIEQLQRAWYCFQPTTTILVQNPLGTPKISPNDPTKALGACGTQKRVTWIENSTRNPQEKSAWIKNSTQRFQAQKKQATTTTTSSTTTTTTLCTKKHLQFQTQKHFPGHTKVWVQKLLRTWNFNKKISRQVLLVILPPSPVWNQQTFHNKTLSKNIQRWNSTNKHLQTTDLICFFTPCPTPRKKTWKNKTKQYSYIESQTFPDKQKTSWWFQPIWKILVQLDHLPK